MNQISKFSILISKYIISFLMTSSFSYIFGFVSLSLIYKLLLAFDNLSQLRKRQIVDTLLTSTKYSPKEIARRVDISSATVYNVKSRQKLVHKKGAGRPNTLRNGIKLSLCQQIRRKPSLSMRTLASQQ